MTAPAPAHAARRVSCVVLGRIMPASNHTFLDPAAATTGVQCVYKPSRGGAAAVGLHRRHAGRPRVRRLGGLRRTSAGTSCRRPCCATGPPGPGMVQLWMEPDEAPRRRTRSTSCPRARCPPGFLHVLDATTAPATSRSRWCTRTPRRCAGWPSSTSSSTTPTARAATCCRCADGHRYGVDHGVCFHTEDKLRTVLWGWAGQRLTPTRSRAASSASLRRLRRRRCASGSRTCSRLREVDAVARRCRAAAARAAGSRCPAGGWPSIPWPPF